MKATATKQAAISLLEQGFSKRDVAQKLDVVERTVYRWQEDNRQYKASHDGADPGYVIQGKSRLLDADGEVKIEWIKTTRESQSLEDMQEAFRAAMEDVKPLPKIKSPTKHMKDILAVYPMGDPHIGMYSWKAETGDDFDCDIAERDLMGAVDDLVDRTSPAETCLIAELGDFFHGDSQANTTTKGTPVDLDSRWPRVMEVGLQIMIRMIRRCLEKHKKVTVVIAIGNHDGQSSIMLAVCLRQTFANNPRVDIRDTLNSFHYHEFGNNLIGIHHGDKVKKENLGKIMAADQGAAWGRTKHRVWLTGHIHHRTVLEDFGVVVESFRTLAGKDSWHFNQGYRAGRDMYSIEYDREYGESDRHRCDILRARQ